MTAVNQALPTDPGAAAPGGPRLMIVSNRLPIAARGRGGRLQIVRSDGGLATGLNEIRRATPSVWIGWPGTASHGSAAGWRDVEQRFRDEGLVPVSLSSEEISGYYDGFSNGVIWPLFHHLLDRIPIDSGDWKAYQHVNERFADAVMDARQPGDAIWIHDYHLMLLPALLRRRLPRARIGFFLHIPFPGIDIFRALPWRRELLEGLLGADVIGFQTSADAQHFLNAVRHLAGVTPMAEHVWWQGRAVRVDVLPIGVDEARIAAISDRRAVRQRADAIRAEANGRQILLGIDRLDYTKGIPRRLIAFQRLLEREPSLRDRVRFIQLAVPSRIDLRAYRRFRRELDELIGRINGSYGTTGAVPIHYLYRSIAPQELAALYRAADVMVVTPLRDGMNLVAKEFVASRTDGDGVLILSEFAGAAAELTDAILVNPYDVDGVASAMARALTIGSDERRARMHRLRTRVAQSSVHEWARAFLRRLGSEEPAPAVTTSAGPDALSAIAGGALAPARPVTLVLDYDGTLVPISPTPKDAQPDADLLNLVTALAANPQIDLHIVTGRSVATVQQWFCHVPGSLWAEHGAARRGPEGTWEQIVTTDDRWMERAKAFLLEVCEETPGALFEMKTTSMAWHYRMVEPTLAAAQRDRLMAALPALLGDAPVEILEGQMVLELRPCGVSKALVVRCLADRSAQPGSIVAIGDDRTDEEMFSAMPPGGIAIRVGSGDSCAGYRLANHSAVRQFLSQLLRSCGGRPRAVPRPA